LAATDDSLAPTAQLIRLARQLELGRREVLATRELEIWEFDVLTALRGAGPPNQLSPSELMAATLAASGTVTNRIDRMMARGLVSRHSDPADRRGVVVKLTPAGRRRIDAAAAAVAETESLLWNSVAGRRRDQLIATVRDLLAAVDGGPGG
jgi:DNA-binding MarR family transcriptional regulator